MISRASFTGLILAGGLARRMQVGGAREALQNSDARTPSAFDAALPDREKGLALLHGEPLVAHACRVLAPQVGTLLISANRQREQFAKYAQVIGDDPALGSNLGPLAGVARGLAEAGTPWLAVVPVDVLGVPSDMVARLAEGAAQHGSNAAYAVNTARQSERAHPLCMIVRRSMAADLLDFLQAGDRKVFMWMSRIAATPVHFDGNEQAFVNINTQDDLEQADRLFSR